MKRYSEFINFPIYLWASKEVDVEVPADEDDDVDDSGMYLFVRVQLDLSISRCCLFILVFYW